MADRMASLRSNQWSCSELAKGAEIAADLAGLSLKMNASTLSREELLKSIQDRNSSYKGPLLTGSQCYIGLSNVCHQITLQEAKALMKNPGHEL